MDPKSKTVPLEIRIYTNYTEDRCKSRRVWCRYLGRDALAPIIFDGCERTMSKMDRGEAHLRILRFIAEGRLKKGTNYKWCWVCFESKDHAWKCQYCNVIHCKDCCSI
jgi:hypothetical protein